MASLDHSDGISLQEGTPVIGQEIQKPKITYSVIHMESAEERMNQIRTQVNILGQPINVFPAVHGVKIDLNKLSAIDPRLVHRSYCFPNEIGCYLSHFILLNSIPVNEEGYTVIFEDDFEIKDERLHEYVQDILCDLETQQQDFDMLYLGTLEENKGTHIHKDVYEVDAEKPIWGTHAYIVKNKNAHKIASGLTVITRAIDNKFRELIYMKCIRALIVNPNKVEQSKKYESLVRKYCHETKRYLNAD